MTDREKIIKGLEKIAEFFKARGDMAVGDGKMLLLSWMRAAEDAIALLEAQEPRVLTLEEIQELHVYWVEDYNGSLIPETVMCIEPHFGNLEGSSKEIQTIPVVRMGNGYAPVITKINHHYNIKWRCWTSRPTDEQREATPWPK